MNAPRHLLTPRGAQRVAVSAALTGYAHTAIRFYAWLGGEVCQGEVCQGDDCPRCNPALMPNAFRCDRCGEVALEEDRGDHWCRACEATCIYCGTAPAAPAYSADEPCCGDCHADHVCTHDDTCDDCRALWAGEED